MPAPRLFVTADLAAGVVVSATPNQAHQLGSVLRRDVGGTVLLWNGRDGEWHARIVGLTRARAEFAVGSRSRPQNDPPDLRLLIGVLKRDAMEWAVEKATELGVARIQPIVLRHSVPDRVNVERLTSIAREAAEQCERLTVPLILPAAALTLTLDQWDGTTLLVAAERADAEPLAHRAIPPPVAFMVGPEGGFAPGELDDLRRRGFVSLVGLGPRILRAETAVVAGLAIIGALGDAPP